MIRICCSKFHRGDPIFGEKPPYEDKSLTHGYCESCFEKEMEDLEAMKLIKSDWREEWREFKKNKGRTINMPRERKPKEGDFVLWDDGTWLISKVIKREVHISLLGESGDFIGDDRLLIDNLAPTPIRTWEVE